MGGDDSQKLLPCRGANFPSRAQTSGSNYEINNVTETAFGMSRATPLLASQAMAPATYRPPGSFLESTGGSVLPRAEVSWLWQRSDGET